MPALYVTSFHVPDATTVGLGPPGPSPSDPTQAALSPLRFAPPHPRQEPSPGGHSPTKSAMSPLHAAPPHLTQVLKDTPFSGARRKRFTQLPDTPPNTASALPAVAEALRESIRVTVASFCSAQVLSASGEGVALSQFWTAATTIAQRIRGDANVCAALITGQGRFDHSGWLGSWRAAVPGRAPKTSKTTPLLHAMRALVQLLLECPHLEFWRPSSLRAFTRTRGYFTSIPDAVYFVFASELVNDCTASSLFQKLRSAVLDARPAPPLPNRRAFLRTHALHGLAFTEARTWWTQIAALRALVTRVCGDDEIFARIDDLELIYTDGEGWKCRPRTPGDTVVDLKRKALEALLNEAGRTITDPVARAALEQLYSDLVSGLRAHTSRVRDLFAVAADAEGWVKIRLTQLESDEVPTWDIMRSDYSLAHWIALYCKRLLQQLVGLFHFLWILPVTYQVRSGPLPARALCVAMVWRELADLGQRNVGADMTAPGLVLLNRACILLGLAEPQPTCTAAKLKAIPFWWRARLVRWRHDWMWEVACDAREHSRGMYDETAFRTWLVDQQSLSDVDVARVLPPESTWRDSLLSRPTARMQKRQKQGLEARVYKQTVTQLIIDARRRDDGTWGDCPPWWHREPPATRRVDDDDGATTPVPDDGETEREEKQAAGDSDQRSRRGDTPTEGIHNPGNWCYAIAVLCSLMGFDCLRPLLNEVPTLEDATSVGFRCPQSRAVVLQFLALYRARYGRPRARAAGVREAVLALGAAVRRHHDSRASIFFRGQQADAPEFYTALMTLLARAFTYAPVIFGRPRWFMACFAVTCVERTTCCDANCLFRSEATTISCTAPLIMSLATNPALTPLERARVYAAKFRHYSLIQPGADPASHRQKAWQDMRLALDELAGVLQTVEAAFRAQLPDPATAAARYSVACEVRDGGLLNPPDMSSNAADDFADTLVNFAPLAAARQAVVTAMRTEGKPDTAQRLALARAAVWLDTMCHQGAYHSLQACIQAQTLTDWVWGIGCHREACLLTLRSKLSFIRQLPPLLSLRIGLDWQGPGSKDLSELGLGDLDAVDLASLTDPDVVARDPILYRVVALVVHRGELLMSGHYVSYVRLPSVGQWAFCDDEDPPVPVGTALLPVHLRNNGGQVYLLLLQRHGLIEPDPLALRQLLLDEQQLLASLPPLPREEMPNLLAFKWGRRGVRLDFSFEDLGARLSVPVDPVGVRAWADCGTGPMLNFLHGTGLTGAARVQVWPVTLRASLQGEGGAQGYCGLLVEVFGPSVLHAGLTTVLIPFFYELHFSLFVVHLSPSGQHRASHFDSLRSDSSHSFEAHLPLIRAVFATLHRNGELGLAVSTIADDAALPVEKTPHQAQTNTCFFFTGLFASTWLRSGGAASAWHELCALDDIWPSLNDWRERALDHFRAYDAWLPNKHPRQAHAGTDRARRSATNTQRNDCQRSAMDLSGDGDSARETHSATSILTPEEKRKSGRRGSRRRARSPASPPVSLSTLPPPRNSSAGGPSSLISSVDDDVTADDQLPSPSVLGKEPPPAATAAPTRSTAATTDAATGAHFVSSPCLAAPVTPSATPAPSSSLSPGPAVRQSGRKRKRGKEPQQQQQQQPRRQLQASEMEDEAPSSLRANRRPKSRRKNTYLGGRLRRATAMRFDRAVIPSVPAGVTPTYAQMNPSATTQDIMRFNDRQWLIDRPWDTVSAAMSKKIVSGIIERQGVHASGGVALLGCQIFQSEFGLGLQQTADKLAKDTYVLVEGLPIVNIAEFQAQLSALENALAETVVRSSSETIQQFEARQLHEASRASERIVVYEPHHAAGTPKPRPEFAALIASPSLILRPELKSLSYLPNGAFEQIQYNYMPRVATMRMNWWLKNLTNADLAAMKNTGRRLTMTFQLIDEGHKGMEHFWTYNHDSRLTFAA